MAALAEKISLGEAIGGVMKIRVRIVFDFEGFFWIFFWVEGTLMFGFGGFRSQ